MEEIIQNTISTTIKDVIQTSNLLFFDTTNMILSTIALLISIWSVIWSIKKSNTANYKNNIYEDILKKALHKELPTHIHKSIDINGKSINNYEISKFENFLMKLRKNILIFKYIDNKFYKKIDQTIIEIDDSIVLISTKKDEFDEKYDKLIKATKRLYKYTKKYLYK